MEALFKSRLKKTEAKEKGVVKEEEKKFTFRVLRIDNHAFRLHYRLSSMILLICAVISSTTYLRDPINCLEDKNIPTEFLNAYCFVHSTYSLEEQKPTYEQKISYYGDAHPGVAPLDRKTQTVNYRSYYMWVSVALYFQSVLFYGPFYIWKCLENGRMRNLLIPLMPTPKDTKADEAKDKNKDDDGKKSDKKKGKKKSVKKQMQKSTCVNNQHHEHECKCKTSNSSSEPEIERENDGSVLEIHGVQDIFKENDEIPDVGSKNSLSEEEEDDGGSDDETGESTDETTTTDTDEESESENEDESESSSTDSDSESAIANVYSQCSALNPESGHEQQESPTHTHTLESGTAGAAKEKSTLAYLIYEVKFGLKHNDKYFRYFIFCELLNLVNLAAQLYLMDYLLGHEFGSLGKHVMNGLLEADPEQRVDVFAKIFPRVTKCAFSKYGPSGNIVNYDGLCVLQMNVLNEKIYAFLWFWFVLLLAATILNLVSRFIILVSARFRNWLILRHYINNLYCDIRKASSFLDKCNAGDWFMLTLIEGSLYERSFINFLNGLSEQVEEGSKPKSV